MKEKNFYQTELSELAKLYPQQEFEHGLTQAVAQKRLAEDGPNRLSSHTTPRWKLFVRQFNNMIIYILLAAALLTLLMGHTSDAVVIALVIIANALIGYYQEASASDALEKIKQLLSQQATVYRDDKRIDLPAEELVVGDVVFLEAGDNVPADLRLVACDNLRVQEAALTGEADSIEKTNQPLAEDQIPLAEQTNMVFASTTVTNGSGIGVVVATGEATELGQISKEVQQVKKRRSPLMTQIDQIGKGVSIVVILAAVVLFILGLLFDTYSLTVLALAVVTMIVGSIPEGLPATTSVILAMGVSEMAKKQQTIVKALPAVETLGSVNVIATDKTGTLTKNEMTVTDVYLPDQKITVTGLGYEPTGQLLTDHQPVKVTAALKAFLQAGFEANDTELVFEADQWQINGEPTDGAFLTLYHKVFDQVPTEQEIDLLPFDSDYRYIAKLVQTAPGKQKIWIKGSPDKLIPLAQAADPDFDSAYWEEKVTELSKAGKRVVAVGVKEVTDQTELTHDSLEGITWLGLAGIIDPPKAEVITALREMKQAGVAVKMITGDHPLTAKTIGEKLGLAETIQVITGAQWDELPAEERGEAALDHQVFARMTPKNKLEIIEALQASGEVTAMTGDGVNDAPALKQADIGVAMGMSGTDVAKDSADMILANDNFATMSNTIAEGRRIYDNIKKSILFLLPTSFAEGLIIAFTILAQQPMPLQATQLLWINMVSAITIQFAFIFEPAEDDIMQREPRRQKSLMDRRDVFQMAYVSILMAIISLIAYEIVISQGADQATASTMMVNVIVASKIFYFFNIRSSDPVFSDQLFANRKAFLIIGLMIALQLGLTYIPFMQQVFQTTGLELIEWGIVIVAGALVLVITEADKWVRRSLMVFNQ